MGSFVPWTGERGCCEASSSVVERRGVTAGASRISPFSVEEDAEVVSLSLALTAEAVCWRAEGRGTKIGAVSGSLFTLNRKSGRCKGSPQVSASKGVKVSVTVRPLPPNMSSGNFTGIDRSVYAR